MIIYPAIDILQGKCVRLTQGDYENKMVYSENPLEVAFAWEKQGAEYLHVVDLNGAKEGLPSNIQIISDIAVNLSIPVQMGGGIRSIEQIEIVLCKGIDRVILGTAAISNPVFVKEALKTFSNAIVIGIDARDGFVAIDGWFKNTEFAAIEFAKKVADLGAKTIVFTDISRDGMLNGPNIASAEEMIAAVPSVKVIVSGGVGNMEHVQAVRKTDASGLIIGKALYNGSVDLKTAIEIAQ